jgi:S1-C subfamily serine protease
MNKLKLQNAGIDRSLRVTGQCMVMIWLLSFAMSFLLIDNAESQAQTRPPQTKKEPLPDMPAKVYEKVAPVTVKIFCDKGKKIGSGVIIGVTEKGRALILTACHVVAMNFAETDPDIGLEFHKDIVIKTNTDVKLVRAGVIPSFVDRTNDLVVLATAGAVVADKAIRYHRTDKINPGERVAALGYPSSDKLSQTVGRITRLEAKYLVFDAKIAPGNSGGPLIDQHGRMIGMNTLIEGGKDGYAVNVNLVTSVVDNWLKNIKLKERWEEQKYATALEGAVKSWRFYAGAGAVLAGGGALTYFLTKDGGITEGEFPKPPDRPPTN